MRKLFAISALILLLIMPCEATNPDNDIIILFTNDVHCGVDENIGYSGLVHYKHELEKLTPYVTLVDAGDWAQGATIGAISQGRYIIEIMNAAGYDFAVPGNHEFDYGWGQFESFARNLNAGFTSCNLRDIRTGQLLFSPYKIFEYGDVKIALLGACTPESIVKSTPSTFMDEEGNYIYDFDGDKTGEKLIASIQKAADDARAEGADYVIVVGHLGEYEDVTEVWSTPYIVPRTRNIDAFIDGHSHEITPALKFKNLDDKEVAIVQTGTKLKNIGKVTIKPTGEVITELISSAGGRDNEIDEVIAGIKSRFADTMSQHLSYTSFDLRAMDDKADWILRNDETNLCNLVTDAILFSAKETPTGKADIGLFNAGGIRANIMPGEITFNDVFTVLPFNNTVCISEVSGQSILDELEMGVRLMSHNSGGLLHVSGMTFTADVSIPTPIITDERNKLIAITGERRIKDAKINGEDLDPEKIYRVASINYVLREGGDGHIFRGAKLIEPDYAAASDALAHYVKTFERLPERYREAEGRMKIIR